MRVVSRARRLSAATRSTAFTFCDRARRNGRARRRVVGLRQVDPCATLARLIRSDRMARSSSKVMRELRSSTESRHATADTHIGRDVLKTRTSGGRAGAGRRRRLHLSLPPVRRTRSRSPNFNRLTLGSREDVRLGSHLSTGASTPSFAAKNVDGKEPRTGSCWRTISRSQRTITPIVSTITWRCGASRATSFRDRFGKFKTRISGPITGACRPRSTT